MALKLPKMSTIQKGSMGLEAFDQKWQMLADAFDQIHACKHANCSFQLLYQASFQLVQQDHSSSLYDKLEAKVKEQVEAQRKEILKHIGGADRALLQALNRPVAASRAHHAAHHRFDVAP
jgi:hypothetical protein